MNEQPNRKPTRSAPPAAQVVGFVHKFAVLIDPVARQIGPQIGPRCDEPRLGQAGLGHIQQRTGFGVALTEEQEVEGQVAGHDDQVGLHESQGQAGRRAGQLSLSGASADLASRGWCQRGFHRFSGLGFGSGGGWNRSSTRQRKPNTTSSPDNFSLAVTLPELPLARRIRI